MRALGYYTMGDCFSFSGGRKMDSIWMFGGLHKLGQDSDRNCMTA